MLYFIALNILVVFLNRVPAVIPKRVFVCVDSRLIKQSGHQFVDSCELPNRSTGERRNAAVCGCFLFSLLILSAYFFSLSLSLSCREAVSAFVC